MEISLRNVKRRIQVENVVLWVDVVGVAVAPVVQVIVMEVVLDLVILYLAYAPVIDFHQIYLKIYLLPMFVHAKEKKKKNRRKSINLVM